METKIFLLCEVFILALAAFAFFKISRGKSRKVTFLLFLGNLILIYFVGETFNYIHHFLRSHQIYIESGHASTSEILIIFSFFLIAIFIFLFHIFIKNRLKNN